MLESYTQPILGNAPSCLVNPWCHQQEWRRRQRRRRKRWRGRHSKHVDSQAKEMKLGTSHMLLIVVIFAHGEIFPTEQRLGFSPFTVPVGIWSSLEISPSCCIFTVPLSQSSSPFPLPQLCCSSCPSLVQARNKESHQHLCVVKLKLFHTARWALQHRQALCLQHSPVL